MVRVRDHAGVGGFSPAPARARRPNALRTPIRTVVALLASALLGATSCSAGPIPELSPDQATDALKKNLKLSTDQLSCMRDAFNADPSVAVVMNTKERPTVEQRNRYVKAIRTCVPIDSYALIFALALRDVSQNNPDSAAACVHDEIVKPSAAEQDVWYMFGSNPAALDQSSFDVSAGAIATNMNQACHFNNLLPGGGPKVTGPPAAPITSVPN